MTRARRAGDRDDVESRRDWRHRPHLPRWYLTVADGEERLQLFSQLELPVTFGVGKRDRIERVVVTWPNGRTEEFTDVATGTTYDCVEGKGLSEAR